MATKAADCPNYETNKQQCPCTETDCERWAICCECISYHAADDSVTKCMGGAARPAETRGLPIGQNRNCANRARNEEICPCGETSCNRHAICCDCVRYHWGHSQWPKTSCMS